MGSRSRKYDMQEIGSTKSSAKMAAHKLVIQKFLKNGYTIKSQETETEEGLGNELISKTLITILDPVSTEHPIIKFEAKEIIGNYDYEEQVFEPRDNPVVNIRTFSKGADVKSFNDSWDQVS